MKTKAMFLTTSRRPEPSAPATTAGQGRDFPDASGPPDNRELRDGTENGADAKARPQASTRARGGASRDDGSRRRTKTTWQLMQEDPSFVPRETRYFLHDDRRDGDEEEADEAEEVDHSQPDFSVPRSSQTRVGRNRKLWTPDEDKDVWKHDMWEKLQKEEAECRTTAHNWNKGRPDVAATIVMGAVVVKIIGFHAAIVKGGFEAARATGMNPGGGRGGRGAEPGATRGFLGSSTSLGRLRRSIEPGSAVGAVE
ncbi:hypothetical protein ACSSS7_001151 [Eimeria intestinalis]